jgi:hypothetical protein
VAQSRVSSGTGRRWLPCLDRCQTQLVADRYSEKGVSRTVQGQQSGRERDEDNRRRAMAVMAASIAPRLDDWLVKPRGTRLADQPRHVRLVAYLSMTLVVVLAGVVVWAIAAGHGAVAAIVLLVCVAASIVHLALWIAATARRR